MKIRPIHLIWLLLFSSTIAIGVIAFWLLGREAKRVEDVARETLANRATSVADNLDFLVAEIRTGIGDSLYTLAEAEDRRSGLARLVAANPFIEAGFFLRESDGVTFWHGDRGAYPDPVQVVPEEVFRDEQELLAERMDERSPIAFFDSPEEESQGDFAGAPTDRLGSSFSRSEDYLASDVAPAAAPRENESLEANRGVKAKSALQQQIAVVRELNVANRRQILETSSQSKQEAKMVEAESTMALAEADTQQSAESSDFSSFGSVLMSSGVVDLDESDSAKVPQQARSRDGFSNDGESGVGSTVAVSERKKGNRTPFSGWLSSVVEGRKEELGWVRFPGDEVTVGAWINSRAVEAELAKALYLNERDGLRLRLLGPDGQVLSRVTEAPSTSPGPDSSILVPVGPSLAGWNLEAFEVMGNPFGRSFRILGAIVVSGLALAILGAGSLLLRQSRKDAIEAQRKTTFVANVSHELKTPLTGIRMFAEMLAEGRVDDPAKRNRYLERISAETQRLSRLVNNVLDFSRLDRRDRDFRPEEMNLVEEVGDFLEMQRPRLADEGLRVEFEPGENTLSVPVDRDALEQILLNLLDNAAKYAVEGQRVMIELVRTQKFAELRVRDFGPGIPVRERGRVFHAFHRVDDRLTSEQSGCGLGLSIASRLAEGMGGNLRLETNKPTGCCFVLSVPLPKKEVL